MSDVGDILKIISIIGLILTIIISIFGFVALKDAMEFKEKFPVEPNLFLLVDNTDILAGAKNLMHEDDPIPITSEEKTVFQQFIDNNDYESLIGRNYKVFLVQMSTFDKAPEGEIGDTGFTKKQAIEALEEDSTKDWFIDMSLEKMDIPEELRDRAREQLEEEAFEEEAPDEEALRSNMFFLLLAAISETEGPTFIIKEYQAENIDVYPETILFKFIKIVPESVVEKLETKISE